MIEKKVTKEDLAEIKKYFHVVLSESTRLGVADKWLINRVVDQTYTMVENSEYPHNSFLVLVERELQKYQFRS